MNQELIKQKLQQELIQRIDHNPRYSLRAMAKLLKTDSSTLSQVMRGKRKLSEKLLAQWAQALCWGPEEVTLLKGIVLETAIRFSGIQQKAPQYRELEADKFAVISDWYHFAILQLMRIKSFRSDAL